MKIIVGGNQSGKTYRMIQECAENGGYMVVADRRMAESVMKMAERMGVKIPFPITFHELLGGWFYARGVKRVYIDDAEGLLYDLCKGLEIAALSMTGEAENLTPRVDNPYIKAPLEPQP